MLLYLIFMPWVPCGDISDFSAQSHHCGWTFLYTGEYLTSILLTSTYQMSDIPFPTKSIKNSPLRNSLLKGKNYRCCVRLFSPHSNLPLYTVIFHITSTGHIISGNSFYPDQENFKALRWSHILCLVTRGYLGLMALTFNLLCLVSDVLNKYHDSCSSFQRGFYK